MNRKIKNIIMIVLIIILGIGMYFTYKSAKESVNNNTKFNIEDRRDTPPNMDSDNNDSTNRKGMRGNLDDSNRPDKMDGNRPSMPNDGNFGNHKNNKSIDTKYYVLFGIESVMLSILIIYMIMSIFNKKNTKDLFSKKDNLIIYILIVLISSGIITATSSVLASKNNNKKVTFNQEEKEKTTKTSDVEEGTIVNDSEIDLSKYSTNITITKSGEYTLTGDFKYSVLVNADGDVKLNLDGVNIESSITGAIVNISTNKLTINVKKDTENTLTDGGSSEYDACIYSNGELVFDGNGILKVYGKQEEGEGIATETKNITIDNGNIYVESNDDGLNAGGDGAKITINDGSLYIKASGDGIDSNKNLVINGGTIYTMGSSKGGDAGIDTDDGYTINGGTLVALGSDMLEVPSNDSKQYTICFTLNDTISSGTLVTLINDKDEVILSFEAKEDFKTLIISSDKLTTGTYYLMTDGKNTGTINNGIYTESKYTRGNKVSINNTSEFKITDKITNIK